MGKETLAGGGLDNHQFNDFIKDGPLATLFAAPGTVWAPRVLKDGADSVGALGALNRVYLNIGTFSEEWTQHFLPLVGAQPQTPIRIEAARRNSAYSRRPRHRPSTRRSSFSRRLTLTISRMPPAAPRI